MLWNQRQLTDAVRAGELALDGDSDTARRFLDPFPLPEPATVTDQAAR